MTKNLSYRRGVRLLRWLLFVYLGIVLVLWLLENRFVYQPAKASESWELPPSPEIQDVDLTPAEGTRVHAWWLPQPGTRSALLYLHGNAGNLSWRGNSIVRMREALGVSVLIIDYPGYGKSEGQPSEEGCYRAADAAYAWLTENQNIEPKNILLYGGSLGGGVAVDLASRKDHRALILVKTFTCLPDVASRHFPWIPVRWLMRNRFPSRDKIRDCRRPIFIAHGDADDLIPCALGQQLFEAAAQPKVFHLEPGTGHNDPLSPDFFKALKTFLAEHALEQ
jgi:uncharacterized protein